MGRFTIKMNLQEIGCGIMGRIEMAQDRDRWRAVVIEVMNFGVSIHCGEFLDNRKHVSFCRGTVLHGVN